MQCGFFHLQNIEAIPHLITRDACARFVHALATFRIDYGNAQLIGVPERLLRQLQRILHVAARIVLLDPQLM